MKKIFKLTIYRRNALFAYMFLLPWLFGLFAFAVYPIFHSLRVSVSSVRQMPGEVIINHYGWGHYVYLFTINTDFREFLINDLTFIGVSLLIVLPFSLIIAVLLNIKFPARALFRLVFFLPVIIMSGPVIHAVMGDLDATGFLNNPILFPFFSILPEATWNAVWFVLSNLVTFMWFSGVQILIFLAGLQKIDSSVYEAASIDGANGWEKFWKITLPYMKILILINAIYTVVEIANFGGTATVIAYDVDDITDQVGQVNHFILDNVTNTARFHSLSAAASWVYFGGIALVIVAILLVYKFFDGGERR